MRTSPMMIEVETCCANDSMPVVSQNTAAETEARRNSRLFRRLEVITAIVAAPCQAVITIDLQPGYSVRDSGRHVWMRPCSYTFGPVPPGGPNLYRLFTVA